MSRKASSVWRRLALAAPHKRDLAVVDRVGIDGSGTALGEASEGADVAALPDQANGLREQLGASDGDDGDVGTMPVRGVLDDRLEVFVPGIDGDVGTQAGRRRPPGLGQIGDDDLRGAGKPADSHVQQTDGARPDDET